MTLSESLMQISVKKGIKKVTSLISFILVPLNGFKIIVRVL